MKQDNIMKYAAVICALFTMFVMSALVVYMENRTILYASGGTLQESDADTADKLDKVEQANTYQLELEASDSKGVVLIPITETITEDKLTVVNDYFTQTMTIYINGLTEDYYQVQKLVADQQCAKQCDYAYEDGITRLKLQLDSVYEYELTKERTNLRLTLRKPAELYDHIVLVDVGHGGSDAGLTVNGVAEKDVVLGVAEAIRGLTNEAECGYYFTRLSDSSVTEEERMEFVHNIGADLIVSIHTAALVGEPEMYGINVFYNAEYYTNSFDTAEFAAGLATRLAQSTHNRANGVFAAEMEQQPLLTAVSIPAVEIELGYLTNEQEARLLKTADYQQLIAAGIIDAIETALAEEH